MPRTSTSPSHPRPKASSGLQTANPRRNVPLQNTASSCLEQAPIDRPSQKNTTESHPVDPSTTPRARQRPKRQRAEQAVERSSSPRIEQHTAPKRERSPDTGPVVQRSSSRRRTEQVTATRRARTGDTAEHSLAPPSEQGSAKKRKRSKDAESSPSARHQRLGSLQSPIPEPTSADAPHSSSPDLDHEKQQTDPVDYWRKHLVWPSNFFESDGPAIMSSVSRSSSTRKKDRRNYSKEIWNLDISDPGSDSPETRARLLKDDPVQMFFIKHSRAPVGGLPDEAEKLVQQLKTQEQSVPSFFDERVLELVGRKTKGKNEAKVVQDVGPFVVPHVDHLNYLDYNSLEHLTESVDDVWSHCIPILASNCPKPDYTAGFYWSRFNDNQLGAIARLGPTRECSFSRGCEEQYFPFFTCEAKGTSGDISEARNQSLETALIASRGLIELFQRASLEDKLQRQILCFSAVYDNTTVEIYAHLAHDVREKFPTFYRHQVASFNFPSDRWASYKLVKNIYKMWAPMHGDLICEALDALAKIPGSMAPPSEPRDRSGRSRSRKDLTSDKSPNPHPKKPKTSG